MARLPLALSALLALVAVGSAVAARAHSVPARGSYIEGTSRALAAHATVDAGAHAHTTTIKRRAQHARASNTTTRAGTLVVTDKDWISGEEGLSDYALRDEHGTLHHLLFTGEQGPPSERWGSGSRIGVNVLREPASSSSSPPAPAARLTRRSLQLRRASAAVAHAQRRQLSAEAALNVDSFQFLPSSPSPATNSSTPSQQWSAASPSPPDPTAHSQTEAADSSPAVGRVGASELPTLSTDDAGFVNSRYGDSSGSDDAPIADEISLAVFIVDMCGLGGGPAATRQVCAVRWQHRL